MRQGENSCCLRSQDTFFRNHKSCREGSEVPQLHPIKEGDYWTHFRTPTDLIPATPEGLSILEAFTSTISKIEIISYELLEEEYSSTPITGNYNEFCNVSVTDNLEHTVRYPASQSKYPYQVSVWIGETSGWKLGNHHDPVFIVLRQKKEVKSWEMPLAIQSKSGTTNYTFASRTLCHNNMEIISSIPRSETHDVHTHSLENFSLEKYLSVSISTASRIPINVAIKVEEQYNFYITEQQTYFTTVTPSQPKYYYYKFPSDGDGSQIDTVMLEVNSTDDVCLTVSVQKPSCPVEDLNQQILLGGKYQTVNRKGGIIIKKSNFPNGFFVVFVAKGDNFDCEKTSSLGPLGDKETLAGYSRESTISFSIRLGITQSQYTIASLTILGIIFVFYVVFILLTWAFYYFGNRNRVRTNSLHLEENAQNGGYSVNDSRSTDGTDEIDARLAMSNLMLSDLAKKGEKYVERKSETYLWHVISIALFYGIPVVQLVVTYQRVVNISGNQDICYYNFLCAHPLFGLSDFNHIYSNIGYVLAGVLFLGIVYYKQRFVPQNSGYGIPKHYGLFYAMGVALIMEGVLSACYHICPNQSNFQFDTSFMYVMAVLCIVKIYQNRHPDVNVTAYSTFVVLGLAIFLAMIGILNGHITLWIIFIILYTMLCIYISFNIYFLSYVKRGVLAVVNEYQEDHSISDVLKPKRKAHFRLLLIANIINLTLACLGILCYFLKTDFATYLLGLLMGNVILYLIVYLVMKLIVHKEKLYLQPIMYCILALVCWAGGTYFFINNSTAWTVTASESRKWNRRCSVLRFYDFHDIWHLLSAPALFFSFMLLLSIDDDLVNVRQSKIAVF